MTQAKRNVWLDRLVSFAAGNCVSVDKGNGAHSCGDKTPIMAPERKVELFYEAGLKDVELFHAALTFRVWVARAWKGRPSTASSL